MRWAGGQARELAERPGLGEGLGIRVGGLGESLHGVEPHDGRAPPGEKGSWWPGDLATGESNVVNISFREMVNPPVFGQKYYGILPARGLDLPEDSRCVFCADTVGRQSIDNYNRTTF